VTIALTATADDAGGFVALALTGAGSLIYTITRTDGAGNTGTVRNGDPAIPSAGSWVGNDYEAPLDSTLTYAATLTTTPFTVTTATSTVTLSGSGGPWLGHPGKPSLNIRILVADYVTGGRAARAQVLNVLGRARPVGQSIRRASPTGSLKVRIAGQDALDALDALLDDGAPLLLRGPANWIGYGTKYLQIGDTECERLTRVATDDRFLVTLPWTEVDRQAGTAEGGAGYRWDDVMTAYATWSDLAAGEATWLDVLDGVP
jgi:hypothetical protein